MPSNEPPGKIHLWAPPPLVADAALKDLLKAHHKRTDTFHVVVRYTLAHGTSVEKIISQSLRFAFCSSSPAATFGLLTCTNLYGLVLFSFLFFLGREA